MTDVRVVFSKRAQRQFDSAAAWWREHGKAPFLFEDEAIRAVKLLAVTPLIGVPGRDERLKTARRLVLQQSQYFLYYRVRETTGVVEILRLWHTSRRSPR